MLIYVVTARRNILLSKVYTVGKDKRIRDELMTETKIFDNFEKEIKQKYGYMAEEMIDFFYDLKDFFVNEEINISDLDDKYFDELFEAYLDYMDLSDAEFAMAYQTFIDFCDYCTSKNIDISAFKDHLLSSKDHIYEYWTEESEDVFDDDFDKFSDIDPRELLENFDSYYDVMKVALKNNQKEIAEVQTHLENIYEFLNAGFTISSKLRDQNPTMSEEELQEAVEKELERKDIDYFPPDDFGAGMFSLPKKQSKKFMEFMIKFDENFEYEPGTKERRKSIEDTLQLLQELIDEVTSLTSSEKK